MKVKQRFRTVDAYQERVKALTVHETTETEMRSEGCFAFLT
jgi:hypothetical protein